MKKTLAILFTVVLLASMVFVGAGCTSNDPKSTKVGFIYVGPVGDGGFTYSQDQGRLEMEKALGVTTMFIESVPETADCKAQMENLIKKGCKIIFATSFGYMPYVDELAKKYPKVIFEHCSGSLMNDTNFGNYFGREYQARYLAGIAAGKATVTNKIGYVAAMKIPECIRGINAFTLGVRSVNPAATVSVVWTNTWYDPTVEKQAADSLITTGGCDVMAQHQDTPSAVAAAEAAGIFSTGYNTSMAKSAPKGYLTSPIWNWGPYFTKVVDSVLKGTFKPESYWGGLETGTIGLDAFGPSVTQETKDAITAKSDEIKSGKWDVFTGPIKDQSGAEKVAAGAKLTDKEMLSIDWFVEGVIGSTK
jgi:basic membrane protein A and related proteins